MTAMSSVNNAAAPLGGRRPARIDVALLARVLLPCVLVTGCGSNEAIGPVSGTVTFQGTPVREGLIVFTNETRGITITARLGEDGSYQAETAGGKGLPVGDYQVTIVPPIPKTTTSWPATPPKPPSYDNIPSRYRDPRTSGLTVEVTTAGTAFPVDMKP